jgi:hypothetical protein
MSLWSLGKWLKIFFSGLQKRKSEGFFVLAIGDPSEVWILVFSCGDRSEARTPQDVAFFKE